MPSDVILMIWLTRLNTHPLAINSDLIKSPSRQSPDTVLTLVNGEKIIVRESAEEVLSRVIAFRRSVLQGIFPGLEKIVVCLSTQTLPKNRSRGKRAWIKPLGAASLWLRAES